MSTTQRIARSLQIIRWLGIAGRVLFALVVVTTWLAWRNDAIDLMTASGLAIVTSAIYLSFDLHLDELMRRNLVISDLNVIADALVRGLIYPSADDYRLLFDVAVTKTFEDEVEEERFRAMATQASDELERRS